MGLMPNSARPGASWGANVKENPTMSSVQPPQRSAPAAEEPQVDETEDDAVDEEEAEDGFEATDALSEETGIDLSDASELDADNVPADEEFDRVMQAPD
jgi:hypothetical protein